MNLFEKRMALLLLGLWLVGCEAGKQSMPDSSQPSPSQHAKATNQSKDNQSKEGRTPMSPITATLHLNSPVFNHQGPIPAKYTCDGADINPPLVIEGIPKGTQSLALVVHDPDAPGGNWDHWLVWNIHPDTTELRENSIPQGAVQGMNDFNKTAYGGPCPPSGTHRYVFTLYALDQSLQLSPGARRTGLEHAIQGHILAQTELIGLYQRQK